MRAWRLPQECSENIHDTIPPRFRLHATESLGPLIIMRRVDVHKEQAVRIAGRYEFLPDFLDPQFLDGKRGLQCSCLDPAAQDVGARRRPRRAERLVAARAPRNHELGRRRRGEPLEQRQREERQIAADNQRALARRCQQRRVDAAERPGARNPSGTTSTPSPEKSSLRFDTMKTGSATVRSRRSWRSTMRSAPMRSWALFAPFMRRARPPARMAAAIEVPGMCRPGMKVTAMYQSSRRARGRAPARGREAYRERGARHE